MARSAILNIIFGAETGQLDRALGGVQKRLRRTAGEFQRLGDSMSRSVSLPIIGLGAAAVKSASDLETLETSFISLAGGANEAAQLVNQLNEFTAKTPFQLEAVGNAARQLIAAGTGVDEVNQQLQFLGDIAATSGSSIDEIAAIFSKVQAKGKVELESLNQLAERGIPIFKALSEATGLPADALGAGAVSVEQFNSVLSSFSEEGGFAAGAMERLSQTAAGKFSTALDNLKLAGAELGSELLPLIKDLLDDVVEMAQSFANLDDGTKKLIIRMAALGAAFGPVAKGIGSTLNGVADLKIGFKGLATRLPKLAAALISPWGATAVLIAGVTAAVIAFNAEANKLSEGQEAIATATKNANDQYSEEAGRVNALLSLYKKSGNNLNERKRILGELQTISPSYFSNLDAEKTSYEDLAVAAGNYRDSLREIAIQKAFGEELIRLETERVKVADELFQAQIEAEKAAADFAETEKAFYSDGLKSRVKYGTELDNNRAAMFRAEAAVNQLTKQQTELDTAVEEVTAKIDRANESLASIETTTSTTTTTTTTHAEAVYGVGDSYREWGERTGFLLSNLEKLSQLQGQIALAPLAPAAIDTATDVAPVEERGLILTDQGDATFDLSGYIQQLQNLEDEYARATREAQFFESATQAIEGAIESSVISIATAVGAAAAGVTEPLKNLGTTLLSTFASLAMELGALAIGYGIAIESIKDALKTLGGPIAIAAGVALLALGAGLQAAVSKSAGDAGVPAFAQGGLVTGPTLAMVGDNASGKEAIIPFERMGEFMKMAGGGQSQQVVVTGRISGKDIVLSNQRGSRDRSRIR